MRYIFLVLFLSGCIYETEADPMNDRTRSTPEQWGQEKVFSSGSWQPGQIRSVLTRDTPRIFTPPQTSTIVMGVVNPDSDEVQDYALRWVLRTGVGGARTQIVFDAQGFTRIAMPIESFSLGLMLDPFSDPPDSPEGDVSAYAFVGEGGVGTNVAEGPQYSIPFAVANGPGLQIFDLPAGAVAVRMTGNPVGSDNPFLPSVFLTSLRGSTQVATWVAGPTAAEPSLLGTYYSGDWLPLLGTATAIQVQNASAVATVRGNLQFKIDL